METYHLHIDRKSRGGVDNAKNYLRQLMDQTASLRKLKIVATRFSDAGMRIEIECDMEPL